MQSTPFGECFVLFVVAVDEDVRIGLRTVDTGGGQMTRTKNLENKEGGGGGIEKMIGMLEGGGCQLVQEEKNKFGKEFWRAS